VLRSKGDTFIINDFAGVNNAIDEVKLPKEFVRWCNGGFFTERQEFQRLNGKKAVGTSTAFGILLSMHQLSFRERNVVVVNTSGVLMYDVGLNDLRTAPAVTSTLMDSFMVQVSEPTP